MLVVYGTAGHGGPFSSCDRSGSRWVDLDGPCWNSLIKPQQPTATRTDIILLTGYALILLCTIAIVLYRCTRLSKKYPIESVGQIVILCLTILIVVTAIAEVSCFSEIGRPTYSLKDTIRNQLSESLVQYGHDDHITRAWQNTMREGCCCAVHGYRDFTFKDKDVPPQCGCYDEEQQPDVHKGCIQQKNFYLHTRDGCTAEYNTNFTNANCQSFIGDKIDDTTESMRVAQLVCVVVSSVCILLCSVSTTRKFIMDDDADVESGSNEGQRPQIKRKMKTVYRFKRSEPSILVGIGIRF